MAGKMIRKNSEGCPLRENFKTAPWFTVVFLLAAAGAAFAGDAPPELKDLSVKVSRAEGVGPAMVPQLQDLAVKVSRAKPDVYYAISPPNPYGLPKKDADKAKDDSQRIVTPSGQVQLKKLKEAKKKPKKIVTGSGRIQLKKIEEAKKKAAKKAKDKSKLPAIEAEAFYLPAELQDLSLTVSRAKPKVHYAINPPNPNTLPKAPSQQDMLKKLRDARQSRDDLNKGRRLAAPKVAAPSGGVQTPGMQDMPIIPPFIPFGVGMGDTDRPGNPCSGMQGGSSSTTPHSGGASTTPGGASGQVTTPSGGGPARDPMRAGGGGEDGPNLTKD